MNSKSIVYCTIRLVGVVVLGVAFVQKKSFIVQLQKNTQKLIKKIVMTYLKVKTTYEATWIWKSIQVLQFWYCQNLLFYDVF